MSAVELKITKKEQMTIQRTLRREGEVSCLDNTAYVKTMLVALAMLQDGEEVRAKIVRPDQSQTVQSQGREKQDV